MWPRTRAARSQGSGPHRRATGTSDRHDIFRRMGWRDTKAFERLTVRMLLVIGVGTAASLGYLLHLKTSGEFGVCATREEPIAIIKSQAIVSISAARIASSGICWPNDMVAVFTYGLPQFLQAGSVSSRLKGARISANSWRSPQSKQVAYVEFPCNSITRSSGTPEA